MGIAQPVVLPAVPGMATNAAPPTASGGPLLAIPVVQRMTGMAPGSQAPDPRAQALIQNPVVSEAIDKAWDDSNPDSPGPANKHEQGGWIRQNSRGDIWVERWPQGNAADINPGSSTGHPYTGRIVGGLLDQIMGNKTLGEFHTHPSPSGTEGPSENDRDAVRNNQLPGIVQGPHGFYSYGGQVPAPPSPPLFRQWLGF